MTYEEKLYRIIQAIREAKKATRQGYYVKVYTDDKLKDINEKELRDILLQLQDDEKVIKLQDQPTKLKPLFQQQLSNELISGIKDYFLIDVLDDFDTWYEQYLLKHKSSIRNMDYINLLKIYDIVLDINEELQIGKSATIIVASLPTIVRFRLLFPVDTVGTRDKYRSYREDALKYLEKEGIVSNVEFFSDTYYGKYQVKVNLSQFEDFYKEIAEHYKERQQKQAEQKTPEKAPTQPIETEQPKNQSDVMYEITFTKGRELLQMYMTKSTKNTAKSKTS